MERKRAPGFVSWFAEAATWIAWVLPHAAGVLLAMRWAGGRMRWPPRAGLWWAVVLTASSAMAWGEWGPGAWHQSARVSSAAQFLWIGVFAAWWRPSSRYLTRAAVAVVVLASLASVIELAEWTRPRWLPGERHVVVTQDGAIVPARSWAWSGRNLLGSVADAELVASEEPRIGLRMEATGGAAVDREGFVRWPDRPAVEVRGTWSDGTPIAGRTFQVAGTFVARSEVGQRGCRGWRFEWVVVGGSAATCEPSAWARGQVTVARTVVVPPDALGDRLGIVWFDVGGLEQRGFDVHVQERVEGDWLDVTERLTPATSAPLTARVLTVEGDRVRVEGRWPAEVEPAVARPVAAPGAILVRTGSLPRVRGWTIHPNVLASTVVVAMATASVFLRRRGLLIATLLGALVVVGATGSRAGIVGGVVIVGLSAVRSSGAGRMWLGSGVVVVVSIVLAASERLRTLVQLSGPSENALSRGEIFQLAFDAILARPWFGSEGGIARFAMASGVPEYLVPSHAHNVWLEVGVVFGAPTLIALLVGTGFLVRWASSTDRVRRWSVLAPVLVLSVADATMLVAQVAVPFALAVRALDEEGRRAVPDSSYRKAETEPGTGSVTPPAPTPPPPTA